MTNAALFNGGPSRTVEQQELYMHQITVSITEASRVLGLGRTTIYALIGRGALATVTIGRRRLIRVDSLHKLLEG